MSSFALERSLKRIAEVARRDGRYRVDAYLFVHQTLAYVELQRGKRARRSPVPDDQASGAGVIEGGKEGRQLVRHMTGQELCEAIRQYAHELYGLMAQVVLKTWGVKSTSDFGEIVYQLIDIGEMTKSATDQRADFDDVYDFTSAFRQRYQFNSLDES